jgi:hypothetical protein
MYLHDPRIGHVTPDGTDRCHGVYVALRCMNVLYLAMKHLLRDGCLPCMTLNCFLEAQILATDQISQGPHIVRLLLWLPSHFGSKVSFCAVSVLSLQRKLTSSEFTRTFVRSVILKRRHDTATPHWICNDTPTVHVYPRYLMSALLSSHYPWLDTIGWQFKLTWGCQLAALASQPKPVRLALARHDWVTI